MSKQMPEVEEARVCGMLGSVQDGGLPHVLSHLWLNHRHEICLARLLL